MARERPGLIQAEFFHLPAHIDTLEDIARESYERRAEGSSIKTVLRFVDRRGIVARMILALAEVERQRWELLLSYSAPTNFLDRLLLGWKEHRVFQRRASLEHGKLSTVVKGIEDALASGDSIVVESPRDYSFRVVHDDELHELLEAARAATGLWLFLFESEDLFADGVPVKESVW